MYTNVFLICDGKLVFDVLGFLEETDKEVDRTVIWTGGNTGALIVFLKCLGFTFHQMATIIADLENIEDFVYGGNLEIGSKTLMMKSIEEWLDSVFEDKKLFKPDITLKEVYKLTNIFPNFITFKNKLTRLNPVETPDMKLRDCVIASLTNYGVFTSYNEYTNFTCMYPFPKEMNYTVTDNSNTLYITNYTEIDVIIADSYIERISSELENIHFSRLRNTVKDDMDVVVVNGLWGDVTPYTVKKSLENGAKQARMHRNGEDTYHYMKVLLEGVKNQS